jgi:hypothetical protein
MVILMCRRSPARKGLGANAPRVLQRTAELIPNLLRFSAIHRLHPWDYLALLGLGRLDPRSGAQATMTANFGIH